MDGLIIMAVWRGVAMATISPEEHDKIKVMMMIGRLLVSVRRWCPLDERPLPWPPVQVSLVI